MLLLLEFIFLSFSSLHIRLYIFVLFQCVYIIITVNLSNNYCYFEKKKIHKFIFIYIIHIIFVIMWYLFKKNLSIVKLKIIHSSFVFSAFGKE